MKVYWDSSAIIFHFARGRIGEIRGVTRPHSLAECFSGLTGGGFKLVMPDGTEKHKRLSKAAGAAVIARLLPCFEFVDLTAAEIVSAIKYAKVKNVQGGRVHDLLHAVAAEKAGADELWTTDQFDFTGLGKVPPKIFA